MDEEVEPRKTREAVFKHIGSVQLPDLLLEVDAATHFSEALLARRPSSSNELLAVYGALLAHGTDIDAKGVGSMIPGIDAAHIATAMRAVEPSGRLPRANERVSEHQNAVPIAALWGDGTKGSADMMAMDASRHLWTARVDPRRRTYAAGMYTHVRDRWGLFYDQPIVLNERQAGVAIEGVELHNRAEDRIRISLLAVDTHGVTNVAMAIVKLLGFDLCPRLRDLRERKLFVPKGLAGAGELGRCHRAPGVGQGDRARVGRSGAPGCFDSCRQDFCGACHPPPGLGRRRRSAAPRRGASGVGALAANAVPVRLPGHSGLPARDPHAAQPRRTGALAAARYSRWSGSAGAWPPTAGDGSHLGRTRAADKHRAGLEHEPHGQRCGSAQA